MKPTPNRLAELVRILELERLEDNLFRGVSKDIGSPIVFGGQVLAQALSAATQTVNAERSVHSLHGYFILPGDIQSPIVYQVERSRDGGTFTTRRVTAIQHGRPIFHMAASFQVPESGAEHQFDMPDVPQPEDLEEVLAKYIAYFDEAPEPMRAIFLHERPVEFRPVEAIHPFNPKPHPPLRSVWIRANGTLPADPRLHRYLLAYASDFNLLTTAMLPHAMTFLDPKMQVASLDHAMWFHRDFRADEWLLYHLDSPTAAGARGFCRGSLFTRSGKLVASVAQEGLMRRR